MEWEISGESVSTTIWVMRSTVGGGGWGGASEESRVRKGCYFGMDPSTIRHCH